MRNFCAFGRNEKNRKKKWKQIISRRIIWNAVGLYFCGILYFSYVSFMEAVPDHIYVTEGHETDYEFSVPVTVVVKQEDQQVFEELTNSSAKQMDTTDIIGSYSVICRLFGIFPAKEVEVSVVPQELVYISGRVVGIYGQTNGVLVLGTSSIEAVNGLNYSPADNRLGAGDYIISVNQQAVETKEQLVDYVNQYGANKLTIGVVRDGTYIEVAVMPVPVTDGKYRIGVWVKDDMAGIGTMTYYTAEGDFGALGHGIGDGETGELLTMMEGSLYTSKVSGITKGKKGTPGEIEGVVYYGKSDRIGEITDNTELGIYGKLEEDDLQSYKGQDISYPLGFKQDIQLGEAVIISDISGKREEYQVEILSVDLGETDSNKGITIQVTDEKLLELTGGIVQGMSGSAILQNGKLIGAVTHVFVNDPAKGYGIFVETMLEAA